MQKENREWDRQKFTFELQKNLVYSQTIIIDEEGDLSACNFTPYQSMGLTKWHNIKHNNHWQLRYVLDLQKIVNSNC